MFKSLALALLFSTLSYAADIQLQLGQSVSINGNSISCGSVTARKCPEVFSTDPNLQNCSNQYTSSACIQQTGNWGFCRQPGGGSADWCVCMPN